MRVIVCGGRDYDDRDAVYHTLADLGADAEPTVIHGAARGADTLAGKVADGLCYSVEEHPADWKRHGRAAGAIRNRQMLAAGADLVLAFPGGKGTENMKKIAREAGVEVREVK